MAERGFAGATTNRIAIRAGVNIGTLYRYFPSKDALLGALIEREARATLDAIDVALERSAQRPIDEVIAALFAATLAPDQLDARVHRELVEQLGRSGRVDVLRDLEHEIAVRLERVIAERTEADSAAVATFVVLHAAEALVHAILFLRPPNVDRAAATAAATAMIAGFLRQG